MNVAWNFRLDEAQVRKLLEAVFTFCALDKQLSAKSLDTLVRKARQAAKTRISRLRPDRRVMVDLDVLGHVIYIWQRSPSYLDERGNPLAIPARGPAPSIEALFRKVRRNEYAELGAKHLLRVGRIRKVGTRRYRPCSEVSIVNGLAPELVNLLGQTMNRLVATVLHNTSSRGKKSLRLIERVSAVPDLPESQIKPFKEFAREQGGALINTINEWLESRRGSQQPRKLKNAKRVTAGLHVFSFIERN